MKKISINVMFYGKRTEVTTLKNMFETIIGGNTVYNSAITGFFKGDAEVYSVGSIERNVEGTYIFFAEFKITKHFTVKEFSKKLSKLTKYVGTVFFYDKSDEYEEMKFLSKDFISYQYLLTITDDPVDDTLDSVCREYVFGDKTDIIEFISLKYGADIDPDVFFEKDMGCNICTGDKTINIEFRDCLLA
ncbi:MAG: hypothetical protein J5992_06300 [Oscillospiraceae bacterium]|nr:hypothetical protein [Oscillospiraceae bacterium]